MKFVTEENGYDRAFKAQASSIKQLEVQVGKITEIVQNRNSGSLPSTTKTNLQGLTHAITTKSGLNYKPILNPLDNSASSNDMHIISKEDKRDEVEAEKAGEESKAQRKVVESYVPPIPFPGRLKKEKEREQS
ncbi:hypothetical protein Tco_1566524 [Tanacetum coccineum]